MDSQPLCLENATAKLCTEVHNAYKHRNPYSMSMIYTTMMYIICTLIYHGTYTHVVHVFFYTGVWLRACVHRSKLYV